MFDAPDKASSTTTTTTTITVSPSSAEEEKKNDNSITNSNNIKRKKPSITCPRCLKEHQVPPIVGVDGFPSSLDILNKVAKIKQQQVCFVCEDNATKGCADCERIYCDECFSLQHSKGKLQTHQSISVEEYLKLNNTNKIKYCSTHTNREVTQYCVQDHTVVCPMCTADGGSHSLHKVQTIDQAANVLMKENEELAKHIEEMKTKLTEYKLQLTEQQQEENKVFLLLFLFLLLLVCFLYVFYFSGFN